MYSTYTLNSDELTPQFIEVLQQTYLQKRIEISVHETSDETEYLLSSLPNRSHLEKSIDDIEHSRNMVHFETLEAAIACAKSTVKR